MATTIEPQTAHEISAIVWDSSTDEPIRITVRTAPCWEDGIQHCFELNAQQAVTLAYALLGAAKDILL